MKNIIKSLSIMALSLSVQAKDELNLQNLTQQIRQETFKQMTSVVVAKGDRIVYEHYFNEGGVEIKNDMRSASKSMTSLAVGLAIEQGLISGVEQKVMPYFSSSVKLEEQDIRKKAMTIEDLLTMSSLLECDDWNNASRGQEERMYIIEDWSQFILNLPVKGTPPWKKTPQNSKYGRAFSYCSGGVQVLTEIIEKVSNQSMSDYLQKHLFDQLAIKPPQFSKTPLGYTNGAGGMRMTSRDWLKIGQLMLKNGDMNGHQIINKKWVEASFTRRAVIDEGRKTEYGYLWWIFDFMIENKPITAFAAAGNGGNYLFMVPELNATVVITSQAYNTNYMHQQSQKILTDFVLPALLAHTK